MPHCVLLALPEVRHRLWLERQPSKDSHAKVAGIINLASIHLFATNHLAIRIWARLNQLLLP
jgi:hypothetical protein